jgi:hypothetical protein
MKTVHAFTRSAELVTKASARMGSFNLLYIERVQSNTGRREGSHIEGLNSIKDISSIA